MREYMRWRAWRFMLSGFALAACIGSGAVSAQQNGGEAQPPNLVLNPIQSILTAHRAWTHVPESIRITGDSAREKSSGPVTITATRREEALIERGSKKTVSTLTRNFSDDGEKQAFARALSGFSQTDVVGVYLLKLLTERTVQIGLPEPVTIGERSLTRLHVKGTRTETHYRGLKVADEFDLYLDSSTAILAGIERSVYPEKHPLHRTTVHWFSDYRETAGGILLPHRIEVRVDNVVTETIAVSAYAVDQPASADLFKPRSVPPPQRGGAQ